MVRLSQRARRSSAVAALGLAVVLGMARALVPDPSGRGTHRQLGLPPCAFLVTTGRPCPTCGMTTAFAWVVRGRFVDAWTANPAGCLIAPVCLALVPGLASLSAFGGLASDRTLSKIATALVATALAITLLAWTIRLISGREAG